MEVLSRIPFDLDLGSLFERWHIETGSEDAERFEALFEQARRIAKPKAIYKESFIDARGEGTVTVDGVTFASRALWTNLEKVERVFPYVATCGSELDGIELSGDELLERFWLDAIKEAVLRSCRTHLNDYLSRRYALGKTAYMSPGSGDENVWPIEQQQALFSLFGNVNDLIGVQLTENHLMIPIKSVSGFLFPTEIDFRNCMLCHRENCPGRSADFDEEKWHSFQRDAEVSKV